LGTYSGIIPDTIAVALSRSRETLARGTTNPLKRMTVRELQTLALVAEGKPYGVIAEHLHVSYKTVANTCTQLKAKLGVRTLPELMRIPIQHLPSATARPPK
jgi:two-component system, NarL family, invasion response regulator UvrY